MTTVLQTETCVYRIDVCKFDMQRRTNDLDSLSSSLNPTWFAVVAVVLIYGKLTYKNDFSLRQ